MHAGGDATQIELGEDLGVLKVLGINLGRCGHCPAELNCSAFGTLASEVLGSIHVAGLNRCGSFGAVVALVLVGIIGHLSHKGDYLLVIEYGGGNFYCEALSSTGNQFLINNLIHECKVALGDRHDVVLSSISTGVGHGGGGSHSLTGLNSGRSTEVNSQVVVDIGSHSHIVNIECPHVGFGDGVNGKCVVAGLCHGEIVVREG